MNRFARRWTALLMVSFLGLGSCDDGPIDPETLGIIIGLVTAEDGTTPIPSATVYVESEGPQGGTTTGVDGRYTLEGVPAGAQVLIAEKGNFRWTAPVTVTAGETITAPNAELAPTGRLGYVPGAFDSIEDIIVDLGHSIEQLDDTDLSQPSVLSQYRMIFLNCGGGFNAGAAATLKAWVQAGGTLYASDWELEVIQAMFPTDILEIGSGDAQTVTASITDAALEQFTGKNTASIVYDLGAWYMLSSLSTTPKVLLRGTVTGATGSSSSTTFSNQPLAISIQHGSGQVIYTTFHNEAGVTADQLAVLRYFIYF